MVIIGTLAFIGGVVFGFLLGGYLGWSWSDFWVNFVSNAVSGGIIGLLLYVAITRPDEQKAKKQRLKLALGMLKSELEINRFRAIHYSVWLKNSQENLENLFPLRFTRGAWNALRESGFLPQVEDTKLVYMLLRINELFVVANNSLIKVRNAWADKDQEKLKTYAQKAEKECAQIINQSTPMLEILASMKLPTVELVEDAPTQEEEGEVEG